MYVTMNSGPPLTVSNGSFFTKLVTLASLCAVFTKHTRYSSATLLFRSPSGPFSESLHHEIFPRYSLRYLRDITNDNSPRNISKLVVHQYHFSEKVNKNCYTYFFLLSHFFLAMTVGFGNRGLHKISLFILSLTELTFKFRRLQNFTTLLWYCLKHKVKIPKIQKWWNWNVKHILTEFGMYKIEWEIDLGLVLLRAGFYLSRISFPSVQKTQSAHVYVNQKWSLEIYFSLNLLCKF